MRSTINPLVTVKGAALLGLITAAIIYSDRANNNSSSYDDVPEEDVLFVYPHVQQLLEEQSHESYDDDLTVYTMSYNGESTLGRPFKVKSELLAKLIVHSENFIELDDVTVTEITYVTAASSNHFLESKDAVFFVQYFRPNATVVYYDLGLTSDQIKQVKSWCQVVYKKFDFNFYPSHVYFLMNYAFKPIIVNEMLQDYTGVMWMDASFRLKSPDIDSIYPFLVNNGGVAQFYKSPHSVFAATDPNMWRYLPTKPQKLKETMMYGANSVLFYRTEKIYSGLVYWWLLCALDEECIAPTGSSIRCKESPDMTTVRNGTCHRYDQSALGTLLANLFDFKEEKYIPENRRDLVQLCKSSRRLNCTKHRVRHC